MDPAPVPRRTWDRRARAEAERLDREWKDWAVLYGAYSRLFCAIAAWPTPVPVILHASTAGELEARMCGVVLAVVACPTT